ncbi:hypothetical protein AB669_20060 [Pedobacter sp. BMA]|nr:hypothetical protein AB669_20060 [Pedobacter sp. BMA]
MRDFTSHSTMEVGPIGLIIIFIVYISLCLISANYGRPTRFGFWKSFALSLIFTPIIGNTVLFYLRNEKALKK